MTMSYPKDILRRFINLSRVGKVSAIVTVVLGGMFLGSAASPPSATPVVESQSTTAAQEEQVKEPVISTKTETEFVSIPYGKTTKTDSNLAEGQTRIVTAGVDGEKTITHTITMSDNVESNRTTNEKTTKAPVDEVTAIGTYVAPKYSAPAPESNTQPTATYYKNCSAARAAGAAPVYVGQPGYGGYLDRDGDGVGCG
jgi:hypothetical protein